METNLFTGNIPNQVRNSHTSHFVSVSGKNTGTMPNENVQGVYDDSTSLLEQTKPQILYRFEFRG